MNLADFFSPDRINLDLQSRTKKDVLKELAEILCKTECQLNINDIYEKLLSREKEGSTGIGRGVALPHAMMDLENDQTLMMFGRSSKGIPFNALDNKPVYLFFLMVGPRRDFRMHLKLLAILSRILQKNEIHDALMKAETSEQILEILKTNGEMTN